LGYEEYSKNDVKDFLKYFQETWLKSKKENEEGQNIPQKPS